MEWFVEMLYYFVFFYSFKLLNCVPIGDIYVLFIDGNVQCFSQWQWYVMAYAAACIVPFFIVLILGERAFLPYLTG